VRFICLGYIDQSKLESITPETFEKCMAYDDELRQGAHFIGGQALQDSKNAVTIRSHNGKTEVTDGPFVETKEQIGGILFLEAKDLNQAIALISKHPGVQMGPFEIRPIDEDVMKMLEARGKAFASKK
jgi:hypothetical protein